MHRVMHHSGFICIRRPLDMPRLWHAGRVASENTEFQSDLRDVLRRAAALRQDQQEALDQTLAFERQLLLKALGTDMTIKDIADAAGRPREFVRRLEEAWHQGRLPGHPAPDWPRTDRRRGSRAT
jgi:hypothetical protein